MFYFSQKSENFSQILWKKRKIAIVLWKQLLIALHSNLYLLIILFLLQTLLSNDCSFWGNNNILVKYIATKLEIDSKFNFFEKQLNGLTIKKIASFKSFAILC